MKNHRAVGAIVGLGLVVLLLSRWAPAQVSRGTILGTVVDSKGGVLPNAQVTVREPATGYERSGTTSALGEYQFVDLPVGTYEVIVTAPNFQRELHGNIRLDVQDRLRIDFALNVGQVSQTVVVGGTATPLIENENAVRDQVIENRTILDMPLNGRDFMTLPLLAPGVTTGQPGNPQTNYFDLSIAANGMPADANEFYVDGAVATVQFTGVPGVKQSIDSIQEFKLLTSTYSAEFGNKAGIHLLLISKSGTNEFHGSAYEFIRNDYFDARNFFALTTPEYRRNDFGATLGGPIKRNRLFFFGDFEGIRIVQGQTTTVRVPTAAELNGDFSADPTIYNPFNSKPNPSIPGQVIRAPFPGNVIPQGLINSTMQTIAKTYYPAPNNPSVPARNYVSSGRLTDNLSIYSGKVDWRVNDTNNAFAKYSISSRPRYNPGTFPLLGADNQLLRPQLATLNDAWTPGPQTVVEVTFAYSRFVANFLQQNLGKNIAGEAGIQGTDQDPFTQGVPRFPLSGGGYATLGDLSYRPNTETDNQYQATAKATHQIGRHSLKAGIDFRHYSWAQFTNAYFNGNFSFNGQFTTQNSTSGSNNGLAEMLLNIPSSASVSGALDPVNMRTFSIQPFINDDWQITPNFTATLGLRWEYNNPWREKENRWAGFDLATGKAIYPQSANTYGYTIPYPYEETNATALYSPDYKQFAPRFGFAYRLFGSDKTVIRGGYGVYYNNVQSVDLLNVGSNYPWRFTKTATSDTVTPQLNVQTALVNSSLPALQSMTFLYQGKRHDGLVQQWSLGVQRQLFHNILLDIAYVGSKHNRFTLYGVNFDQPQPGPGAIPPRRPYPAFSGLTAYMFNSSGNYNGLQVKGEKRFNNNLGFLTSFTYSKTLDDSEGYQGARDLETWLLYGLGSQNIKLLLTTEIDYQLPFGQGKVLLNTSNPILNGLVAGWQISGILTLQSGFPFTPTLAGDVANCGCSNYPNQIANGNLPSSKQSINRWFDPTAFTIPTQYTLGNVGKNILIGPGLQNLDTALFKNFRITDRFTLQARGESFNVLNHPNFGMPATQIDVHSTVGVITSANAARQIQLGMKVLF